MSNYCSTGITFYSDSKPSVEDLKAKMETVFYSEPSPKPGYGRSIEDYVRAFYPLIDAKLTDCRGSVTLDKEIKRKEQYYSFTIFTETPGIARIGPWYKIIQDFYPNIKIAYVAEECGCEYFTKWDEDGLFFPDDFYMDICYPTKDGDLEYIEEHGFRSLEKIYDWLDNNLPFSYEKMTDADSLEFEIISKLTEFDESDEYFCTIAKYREVHPADYNFYK